MQSKFEKFNELPPELQNETAQNLSIRDLVNLARTSKKHLALFKPVIDVCKLLHHVTRGEHDVVNAMLKQDISLILKRGIVKIQFGFPVPIFAAPEVNWGYEDITIISKSDWEQ